MSVKVYAPGMTIIQFDPDSYSKDIAEDAGNIAVFTVSAKGPSGILYEIVGGNINNAFNIGRQNGQVRVAGSLDRETQASYKLVIRAFKNDSAAEVTTTINIADVNDNTPRITFVDFEPKKIAIEDYSPKGSHVIKVSYGFKIDEL